MTPRDLHSDDNTMLGMIADGECGETYQDAQPTLQTHAQKLPPPRSLMWAPEYTFGQLRRLVCVPTGQLKKNIAQRALEHR